ncbi:Dph6-related ATP pyrophosphatase [Robertkochia sediminum]|uniref:Dph6-related ATP pyrophosphatase n=1 Tax=Robertkochia sediminum TaxID=2785326 RepID=UPI001932391D|nr:diphthine--ammonia ligase [Robertkochia sediminum]MBL7473634.1 diphthine--ammonia ligase [Robertkochia sediminum]
MITPKNAYVNWSSGKDSCLALYRLLQDNRFQVGTLVTTLNDEVDRVSMHGLPKALLFEQVKQIGLPLHTINLPGVVSMEQYGKIMDRHVDQLKNSGYTFSVFGDIFLEDLKNYREEQLASRGIRAVFPLWGEDSKTLIEEFIDAGFKAITVSVSDSALGEAFLGRVIDRDFLNELPEGVDPCGENGEFHTFVFDGPIFRNPVSFRVGEKVLKTYKPHQDKKDNCFTDDEVTWDTSFWFCDLIPD